MKPVLKNSSCLRIYEEYHDALIAFSIETVTEGTGPPTAPRLPLAFSNMNASTKSVYHQVPIETMLIKSNSV